MVKRLFRQIANLSWVLVVVSVGLSSAIVGQGPEGVARDAVSRSDRAPFGVQSEWISGSEGLARAQGDITFPLLFFETSPPPLVKAGFGYTRLFSADDFALPENLYEYTVGLSWIRPVNDRWTIRTMLGVGLATDGDNLTSDAWQFRGGVFAMLKQSPQMTWTFGALATGRDDLPVIPAVGAVWQPNQCTRVDFLFPQPKVNWLLCDDGVRQEVVFAGFGINGTTWGYESTSFGDDRLTYKDVRVMLGWESRPSTDFGRPFARGRTTRVEVGYAISREFEFENETRTESLQDGFLIGVTSKF